MLPTRSRLIGLTAIAGALGVSFAHQPSAAAQQEISGTPYLAVVESNQPYAPLPGGTRVLSTTNYFSSPYSANVTLPFEFQFYNTLYPANDTVTLALGGLFFSGSGFTTQYFPSSSWIGTNAPNAYIAPLWNYLEFTGGTSGLYYQVLGTAPNRVFAAEWRGARGGVFNRGQVDLQIRLYEGPLGRFEIQYAPTNTGNAVYSFVGIMGMEDAAGDNFISFAATGGFGDTSSPCAGSSCPETELSGRNGQRITMVQARRSEISVPQFATLGVPISIPVRVSNLQRDPFGPATVRLLAGRNRDISGAVEIGSTVLALGAFSFSETEIPVNLDPALGIGEESYYLFLDVSGREPVRSDSRVRVLPSRPDLRVDRVDTSARQVEAGGMLDVYVTVTNAGSQSAGGVDVAALLSSNPVMSLNDAELGITTVTLGAGETTTATISVTIDPETNSGAYFIGALADYGDTVPEINESNNGLAAFERIDVRGGTVGILTTALPQALLQETYTAILRATGGSGRYRWERISGRFPQGIEVVASSGEFYGRAIGGGCEDFTVQVTDVEDSSQTDTQDLTLCVTSPTEPLTIVTRSVPPAIIGQEYAFQLVATGGVMGGEMEWNASGLPPGFQVTSGGVLAGTGTEEGSITFDVTVDNSADSPTTRTLTLDVQANGNLQIATTPLLNARLGESYTHQFTSTGGIEPITWSDALGQLRDTGLDLSPDGELSGVPLRAGTITFTVSARDAGLPGRAARDQNTFTLLVEDDGELQITTESLPEGNVDAGYDRSIAAIGGLPPYTWKILSGRVPEGLQARTENLVTNELEIGGTPSEETVSNLLVEVTDSEGRTATRAFVLVIGPPLAPEVIEDDDGGCTATRTTGTRSGTGATLLLVIGLGLLLARRRR